MENRTLHAFERLDLLEWQTCHRLAGYSRHWPLRLTMRIASRLGDWPIWAVLIACQALLHGIRGGWLALQFALTAGVAALIYRLVKTRLCRERPFITFTQIACTMPPMDRYSFPSGHTMHAVAFTTLTADSAPWLLAVIAPLAVLIAVSRVVLGLHYLSDVAAGALLGYLIAEISLWLWPATPLWADSFLG